MAITKTLSALAIVLILAGSGAAAVEAKGGRVGGGVRVSSPSRVSTPKPTTPKPSASPAVAPAPKPTAPKPPPAKPSATTPKVEKATPVKPGFSNKGNVVGPDYQPRFRGGYSAPAGSVVYYQNSNDWMMWIPLLYLMNNDAHRDAVVETPGQDGTASTTQVVQEEGVDSMYVINWIITILLGLGLIALAMWLVNKFTNKKKAYV